MNNHTGWAFLIPFVLLAVILLVVMVAWTPSDSEPKAPSPDPLYDWAEEGDFKRVDDYAVRFPGRKNERANAILDCEQGCEAWRFIGPTLADADALREEHYAEHHR